MTLKIAAVGDITLGDHPMCTGFGAHSKFKGKSSRFPYEHVTDLFNEADLVFGNLECVLSETGLKKNDYDSVQMRGYPDYVKGLVAAGISVVNFATNHSMQHGKEPFLETVELLKQNGIQYCGVNTDNHLVGKPVLIEKNNLKIAFLGYSLRPRQYFEYDPLYSEGNEQNIIEDVKKVKSEADIVCVSMHWGDEFIDRPSPNEIKLGHEIIDAGADLIIGHHPHVLKAVEKYKQGYIAYSLGNFVCDMIWEDRLRESLILNCEFSKNGIKNLSLTPIFINDSYQPKPLENDEVNRLLKKVESMSNSLNVDFPIDFKEQVTLYEKDADSYQRKYRNFAHHYFLTKIYKFPILILWQQILTYVKNRFHEIFEKKKFNQNII